MNRDGSEWFSILMTVVIGWISAGHDQCAALARSLVSPEAHIV